MLIGDLFINTISHRFLKQMIMFAIVTLIAETTAVKFLVVTKSYNTFIMLKSLHRYDEILQYFSC